MNVLYVIDQSHAVVGELGICGPPGFQRFVLVSILGVPEVDAVAKLVMVHSDLRMSGERSCKALKNNERSPRRGIEPR